MIDYLRTKLGTIDKDNKWKPLLYGVEATSKTEIKGMYFCITHCMHSQAAQQYLSEHLVTIYQESDTYHGTEDLEDKYTNPYIPSYEQSSHNIARKIALAAKPSTDGDDKNNLWDNPTFNQCKNGIIIDYEDFPNLQNGTVHKPVSNHWEQKGNKNDITKTKKHKTDQKQEPIVTEM